MKRFVTLFPYELENSHLIKDVGRIPQLVGARLGLKPEILSWFPRGTSFSFLTSDLKGVVVNQLGSASRRHFRIKLFFHLLFYSRSIEVLHLFFWGVNTFWPLLLFRIMNPSGRVYVKLDQNSSQIEEILGQPHLKARVLRGLGAVAFRGVTFASCESSAGLKAFKSFYPKFENKIGFVPNGIFLDEKFPTVEEIKSQKEDIILVLGRIGLPEKNHGALLEAIPRLDLGNWKIAFVGPIQPNFTSKVDTFFEAFPHLREKVQFFGPEWDRNRVHGWFRRSKLFVLTSKIESFAIVLVEAMAHGCDVVAPNHLDSVQDITASGQWGHLYDAQIPEDLLRVLQEVVTDSSQALVNLEERMIFAERHFNWNRIADFISEKLAPPES